MKTNTFHISDAINRRIDCFLQVVCAYPHYAEIERRMQAAQGRIGYEFQRPALCMLAFCRAKADKTGNGYKNETLAQIGDALLDTVISERFFAEGNSKQEIDNRRQGLGDNQYLFSITIKKSFRSFCYHERFFHDEAPQEDQVSAGSHDSLVEAIIGAIYLDGGIDKARQWIYENVIVDASVKEGSPDA